jgi:hypothetical protein
LKAIGKTYFRNFGIAEENELGTSIKRHRTIGSAKTIFQQIHKTE